MLMIMAAQDLAQDQAQMGCGRTTYPIVSSLVQHATPHLALPQPDPGKGEDTGQGHLSPRVPLALLAP